MLQANSIILQMSSDLGMLPKHLQKIIQTAPLRYKIFYIPKRTGGMREVAQPAREVKAIQRWFMNRLSPVLPIHDAATAYRPGGSIKQNALRHMYSNYMLKMDFQNFFPSILMSDVVQHLALHCEGQYDLSAMRLIAYICTWAPRRQGPLRLCIGAPSSPLLSNSVMYEFDVRLAERAKADGVTYSRYADDLTLSATDPNILEAYPRLISEIASGLSYPHLALNDDKTVFASRAVRRIVTGITLTSDRRISIGRERKRLIRSMYHRMTLGTLPVEQRDELGGLVAFAEDIEPGFTEWLKRSAE